MSSVTVDKEGTTVTKPSFYTKMSQTLADNFSIINNIPNLFN
ncbi:hypothetical protein [Clostridium estertheticum]|nr:hypothetical protein [Clostridium estertheticum]